MSFQLTVKDNHLTQELNHLQTKLSNLKPLLEDIGDYLLEITENAFESESSPDGKAWRKLDPKYLNYKNKIGRNKKLQIEGDLARSIESIATSDRLIIGSNLEYAPIHQFGGFAGKNHKAFIPARPFLPVDADGHMYQEVIEDILYMLKEFLD